MRSTALFALLLLAAGCGSTRTPAEGDIRTPDGVKLHYRIVGSGPRTVLVPLIFWNVPRFEHAPKSLRFVFYDPRGRGRSEAVPPENASVQQDVDDLETVRRAMNADRVALIGTSYYGALVARYAMLHPDHVTRVVMVGAGDIRNGAPRNSDDAERARRVPEETARSLEARRGALTAERYCEEWWSLHAPLYVGRAENSSRIERNCHLPNEQPQNFFPHMGAVLGSLGTYDWRDDAKRVTAPVLVIHGARDLVSPISTGREWAAALPNATFTELPEGGHLPWYEDDDEIFGMMFDFLGAN